MTCARVGAKGFGTEIEDRIPLVMTTGNATVRVGGEQEMRLPCTLRHILRYIYLEHMKNGHFTVSEILAGAFALVVASVGATWYLRGDRIEKLNEQLAAYRESRSLDLASGLNSINKASAQLAVHLKEFENIQQLRTENAALRRQVANIEALRIRVQDLEKQLAAAFPDVVQFVLPRGESKTVAANQITVGFVTGWPDRVDAIVNDRKLELYPGQSTLVTLPNRQCRVTLDKYAERSARTWFSVACTRID